MRKKYLVANWKMFKTPRQAREDFLTLARGNVQASSQTVDCAVAAPTLYLSELALLARSSPLKLLAQNCHWASEGAFTGEIAAPMLKETDVRGSLVGHSERRQHFGETDETAGRRVGALLRAGLEAILCVGETLEERKAGKVEEVLTRQLTVAMAASGLRHRFEVEGANAQSPLLALAYEPVWAIGTGQAATPVEAREAHGCLRRVAARLLGAEFAERLRILYGGSVNPQNVASFVSEADVDGALVGGASLAPESFEALRASCAR